MDDVIAKIRATLEAFGCEKTVVRSAKHGTIIQGVTNGSRPSLGFGDVVNESLRQQGVMAAVVEYVPVAARLTVYAFAV